MTDLADVDTLVPLGGAAPAALRPGGPLPPPGAAQPAAALPPPYPLVPPPQPVTAPAPAAPSIPAGPAAPSVPAAAPADPTVTVPEYRPPSAPMAPAAPAIPATAAALPSVSASMSARPGFDTLATASARRASRRRGRRFGKSLFVLVVLGGLGAAGYVYGPELLERVREEQADQAPGSDEPAAPLEFPTQTAPPMEVRNATFVVDGLEADGATRRHEVTTDFETRVSRVLIDREDLPTLEVMTFLDSAVVRRIDRNVWYQTARGQFPLDDQLERDRWVRHLDELIPAMNRPAAAIEASTTAVLAGERMRHLVVTIDPRLLAGPSLHGGPPAGPPLEGVAPTDAARAAEPAPQAANPTDVAGAAPPIEGLPETETAPGAAAPVSIELWIDSRGLIRQLVIPDELGGDTLTVTAISPEAWIPDFPTEEQIEPLTASALVELGL